MGETGGVACGRKNGETGLNARAVPVTSELLLSGLRKSMFMAITLLILGLLGGFLSGLLGVGGAIVMIPLLLAVPPLVKAGGLPVKTIAGLSMLQALASSISGVLVHHKNNFVDRNLLLYVGIPTGLCSFVGACLSKYMADRLILLFFGVMVLAAFVLLLKKQANDLPLSSGGMPFSRGAGALIGGIVGFISGAAGAGGGFVLIPLMVSVLKIPVKVAVGTSMGIVFLVAVMGSIGKILSLQVSVALVLPLLVGAVPGARLGAMCSKSLSPGTLQRLLLAVVLFSLLKVGWSIFFGGH
jgi:uncharacterized membrane protein YfcA